MRFAYGLSEIGLLLLISVLAGLSRQRSKCFSERMPALFTSQASRVFTFPLPEGQDPVLLTYGRSSEFKRTFTVNVPTNLGLNISDVQFLCDDTTVLDGRQDCKTQMHLLAASDMSSNVTVRSYRAEVVCIAERFPGITSCKLSATLVGKKLGQAEDMSVSPPSSTVLVSGLAIYDLNGTLPGEDVTRNTQIYSGIGRHWRRESFNTNETVSIVFGARIVLPSGERLKGERAKTVFNDARLVTSGTDSLFLYDASACRPGNFSATDTSASKGVFELAPPESCGFGTAPPVKGGDAILGFRLRPLKSGKQSVEFYWWDFGLEDGIMVEYRQMLSMEIGGHPPPVLKSLKIIPGKELSHIPCRGFDDKVSVTMYNIKGSISRIFQVLGADGQVVDSWEEDHGSYSYDITSDTATMNFTSSGGSGRNVPYRVDVLYRDSDPKTAVAAPGSTFHNQINFSLPLALTYVHPAVVDYSGGVVALQGSFHGFMPSRDAVLLGQSRISRSRVIHHNASHIEINAPSQHDEGEAIQVSLRVMICEALSNKHPLVYGEPPVSSISSLELSPVISDSSVTYEVPSSGHRVTFLGRSKRTNLGLSYAWELRDITSNSQIKLRFPSNQPMLFLNASDIPLAGATYNLSLTLESPSGRDRTCVKIKKRESSSDILEAVLHPISPVALSRAEAVTQVYATVTLFGRPLEETGHRVFYEWYYGNRRYVVGNIDLGLSTRKRISETGPTLLGQQFAISKKDLVVGSNSLTLLVQLSNNRSVTATATTTFLVFSSPLVPVINSGAHGTLIRASKTFTLTARHSYDPDSLFGGSTPPEAMRYEWTSCVASTDVKFKTNVSDCSDVIPSTYVEAVNLPIQSEGLRKYATSPETFFTFGLRVSKGNRSRATTTWFRFRLGTDEFLRDLPEVDLVIFEDFSGNRIDPTEVNHLTDFSVRPQVVSNKSELEWMFDTTERERRNTLQQALRGASATFFSFQRSGLTIAAGKLEPGTHYELRLTLRSIRSKKVSNMLVSFKTSRIPRVSCSAPQETSGTAGVTEFAASVQSSFESPLVQFCFSVSSSPDWIPREVGFGCTPLPFAKFVLPSVGAHYFSCELRALSGALLSTTLAESTSTITTSFEVGKNDDDTATTAENVVVRTARNIDECTRLRDHRCLYTIISYLSHILPAKAQTRGRLDQSLRTSERSFPSVRLSNYAGSLENKSVEIVEQLSSLDRAMSFRTVHSPCSIAATVRRAYLFSMVSASQFDSQSLLDSLVPTSLAVDSSISDGLGPVISSQNAEMMRVIANSSISKAGDMMKTRTTRRRLNSWEDVASSRALFGLVLDELPLFLAHFLIQQEACGFEQATDTSIVGGENSYPSVKLYLRILCDPIANLRTISNKKLREFPGLSLRVCPEAIRNGSNPSFPGRYPLVLRETDARTFCSSRRVQGMHTIFTAPTLLVIPRNERNGRLLPPECVKVRVPRIQRVACHTSTTTSNFHSPEPVRDLHLNTDRTVPQILNHGVGMAGGAVSALGTIKNASIPADEVEFTRRGISVFFRSKWVSFRFRQGADFVAGHPEDPGPQRTGVNIIWASLCVGIGCALPLFGLLAMWRRSVVGVPQREPAESEFVDRSWPRVHHVEDVHSAGRSSFSNDEYP